MVHQKVRFAGIDIDDEPLSYWVSLILSGRRVTSIIVTPNVDHFSRLDNDSDFANLYSMTDYILCDSRIIQKVSYFTKQNYIKHVVPGSDLTRVIFEKLKGSSRKILIIGSSESDVQKLRKLYSLNCLSCVSPSMGFIKATTEVDAIISQVMKERPEIVFLAVGSPQQEMLAVKIKQKYNNTDADGSILLCVGASIDFIAGKTRRAPLVIQKAHLEWLYRAFSEPRRLFPRYLKNFFWLCKFIFRKN